jgi:uncharacterized protein DUF6011
MTTTTRERNYRKHPHTARFLMTFHAAAQGLPADAEPAEDLLDEVPVEAPRTDRRSPAQRALMDKLIGEITELDAELGAQARAWTDGMTGAGEWTYGRDGRTGISRWIDSLIAKINQLKARTAEPQAPAAEVADGRYAVEEDGVLKFFKVTNGRVPGFVFLDVQASDEWHAIRNVTRIKAIVALIAKDAHAAMIRYGHELGECGRCGRTLTDEASRAAGIGPICAGK